MESWRVVWRDGIEPLISDEGLAALAAALTTDDPRLLQGATCTPPPLFCVQDWPVEAACALGYCGWQDGRSTVAEVSEYFSGICFECDKRIGEPCACRHFINWHDETPRHEMHAALLSEVHRALALRAEKVAV